MDALPLKSLTKGGVSSVGIQTRPQIVPNKMHLIWCGKRMPDYALHTVHRFCARARRKVRPYSINLWLERRCQYQSTQALHPEYMDMEKAGILKLRNLDELNDRIKEEYTDKSAELFHQFTSREGVGIECQAARADIYRLEILRQEGGIYSDMDADFYPWAELAIQCSRDSKSKEDYLAKCFERMLGIYSLPKPFESWSEFYEKISQPDDNFLGQEKKELLKSFLAGVTNYIFSNSSRELVPLLLAGGFLFKSSDLFASLVCRDSINNNLIAAIAGHEFLEQALLAILNKHAEVDSITKRLQYGDRPSLELDGLDNKRLDPDLVLNYSGPYLLTTILKYYTERRRLERNSFKFPQDLGYLAFRKNTNELTSLTFAGLRNSERSYENDGVAHGARSWNKKPSSKFFDI